MNLTVADLKDLLKAAKRAGTLEHWADIAVTWMEAADAEIFKLKQQSKEFEK